jgi:hypothetical protein
MKKIEINSDYNFTFDNDVQLSKAEMTGYIESYDMVRICLRYPNGNTVDFPLKTREDYFGQITRLNEKDNDEEIVEIYQDTHMFDIQDYN